MKDKAITFAAISIGLWCLTQVSIDIFDYYQYMATVNEFESWYE
tara:strand:- start:575 stop:706 length:132 start_codon:yes stop_codon:yes gene_type:complete